MASFTAEPISCAAISIFLLDLKKRIRASRLKAAMAVNRELIELYWGSAKTFWSARQVKGGVPG